MPVIVDGDLVPTVWAKKKRANPVDFVGVSGLQSEGLTIALINNMPDAALEDTELQFFELLNNAAGDTPIHVKLYSLPNIPRSERGQQHIRNFYLEISDLLNSQFDGVIVTGTEPLHPDLRDEPYWPILTTVLDWTERSTSSTILSCLAAHAGALHSDGIPRYRLADKQFGIFEFKRVAEHRLADGIADRVRFPHSRWNEVREDALLECGYLILARSPENGVDSFVKMKGKSLFLHFQGHPEYVTDTLSKEYRRDIKRFFTRERETYPSMPQGYFDAPAAKLLNAFQANALSHSSDESLTFFPDTVVTAAIQNTWRLSATSLYRNWLEYMLSRKAENNHSPCPVIEAKSTPFS